MSYASSLPLHTYAPGSQGLKESFVQGYQPYSRIGEVVVNAFIDPAEYTALPERPLTSDEMKCDSPSDLMLLRRFYELNILTPAADAAYLDQKPDLQSFCNVLPGQVCVQRKGSNTHWKSTLVAETAAAVITCAAGMPKALESEFSFAGISRSPSVKTDDSMPSYPTEPFTLAVGGIVTVLNTGTTRFSPGDGCAWTFEPLLSPGAQQVTINKRQKIGPRLIQIVRVPPGCSHPRQFGVSKSAARPGEHFDVLLGPTMC